MVAMAQGHQVAEATVAWDTMAETGWTAAVDMAAAAMEVAEMARLATVEAVKGVRVVAMVVEGRALEGGRW